MFRLVFLAAASLFLFKCQAQARVKVVDGDSLEIGGKKIRLVGIDSPEFFQICETSDGKAYECGQEALKFMQSMVDAGAAQKNQVVCKKVGTDRYNRALSLCFVGEKNLNLEMVLNGWAVVYRNERFVEAEQEAKSNHRGIWQGKFMRPELYRILNKYTGQKR